jgi:HK97 family phage major capsid protein
MRTEKQIHELRGKCYSAMTALTKKAADESRAMTPEEESQWDKAHGEMQSYDREIERLRTQAQVDAEMNTREAEFSFTAPADKEKQNSELQRFFKRLLDEDFRVSEAEARRMAKAEYPTRAQMSTDSDAKGSYTVPQEFVRMLEVYMKAYGGMMQAAYTHNSTRGGVMRLPTVNDTTSTGAWQSAERSSGLTSNNFTFSQVTLGDFTWADIVLLTWEIIQDEDVDFVSRHLAELFGVRAGRALNKAYTDGDGSGKPTGILAASGGASTGKTAASATAITKSEIIDLVHSVDPAYRVPEAAFMLNDATLAYILKLDQTTNVAPIWQPSFQEGIPGKILGYNYVINQDFPTIATGNKTIAFGDWSKYFIRNVQGFGMVRLKERFADQLADGFLGWLRTDGKLVNTSAIKLLVQA